MLVGEDRVSASDSLGEAVRRAARLPGARGALLASLEDGLTIASVLPQGVDGDALAALGVSIARRAALACQAAGFGPVNLLLLDAAQGHLVVAVRGELAMLLLAQPGCSLGLLRKHLMEPW
jgi:predicted regulator of Ras-like GTPase activity (Roadblock/LC7/MglB family)